MLLKGKLRIVWFIGILLTTGCLVAQLHELPNHWIEAKTINGNFKAVTSQPDIEVFSAPNIIMVKVNHEVEVRIYTILGKLISAQNLQPGIYQHQIDSHGIYIVKTDDTSCKIAI